MQVEVPFPLGAPDGRYLVRAEHAGRGSEPSHVLVLATVAAPAGRELPSGRATVISLTDPFADDELGAARRWLSGARLEDLRDHLDVLRRALRAHRLIAADPVLHPPTPEQLQVVRLGVGSGEEVADGRWTEVRELPPSQWRRQAGGGSPEARSRGTGSRGTGARRAGLQLRRGRAVDARSRLADVLRQQRQILVCEELALRARGDLDDGRERAAALQLSIALDAALAELPLVVASSTGVSAAGGPTDLRPRIEELRGLRAGVEETASAALHGELGPAELELVGTALARLEAALRARAVTEDRRR